ncbi:hypothetical protein JTE90_005066 [Oedothorax gibbosus]|uniref:Uncharacterized protein n=1 Tax=Oedothorax gibbosus TaxID=931172 RepID=A0AAV6VCL9_9ARAC|nr:hypothetical protein JTE90_005066 [Oedothorax gibbosus]
MNLRRLNICGFLLHLIHFVSSQCVNGYEKACVWKHDEKSALKWVLKKESDGTDSIQLTGCEEPNCGIATVVSPWLPPRSTNAPWPGFSYKIYGYSSVYLRVYLQTEDGGQHQVFSKDGNYAMPFPQQWSVRDGDVVVKATPTKHRLLIKAHTPYKEAFVAVRNINMQGSIAQSSTRSPTSEREEELKYSSFRNHAYHVETTVFKTLVLLQLFYFFSRIVIFVPDEYDVEEKNEIVTGEEGQSDDQYLELEENFFGAEELRMGYTKVMDPQICKYG